MGSFRHVRDNKIAQGYSYCMCRFGVLLEVLVTVSCRAGWYVIIIIIRGLSVT